MRLLHIFVGRCANDVDSLHGYKWSEQNEYENQ
jgi:hypothetical protein